MVEQTQIYTTNNYALKSITVSCPPGSQLTQEGDKCTMAITVNPPTNSSNEYCKNIGAVLPDYMSMTHLDFNLRGPIIQMVTITKCTGKQLV